MNELAKRVEAAKLAEKPQTGYTKVGGKLRVGGSPLENRVKQAEANRIAPKDLPNRIILACDCSSSMHGEKIQILRDSADAFAGDCLADRQTALGLATFPSNVNVPLTNQIHAVKMTIGSLRDGGGTPMKECLERIARTQEPTRVVLISDGQPTDWPGVDDYYHDFEEEEELPKGSLKDRVKADKTIQSFLEREIPIDCVHIDRSHSGEKFLKALAEVTGGIFVKFSDVRNLRKGLKYLTPQKRLMLTAGRLEIEGATEVKI